MQFMISRNTQKNAFDKFDVQDIAIEKFRKFATEHNVHLTLVVHPRKEDETSKLSISSIYGSAKATQEADTVIILQHDGRRKFIDVKKNRFDGTLGYLPIYYESRSGRYVEDERIGDKPGHQNSNVSFQPPRPEKTRNSNIDNRQRVPPEPLVDPFEMYLTSTTKRA
jgi:twinkle protein